MMTTLLSPHCNTIKARAVELLTSPDGFNGYSAVEITACKGFAKANNVCLALCYARDEIEAGMPREERLNKGGFNAVAAAIARELKRIGP